MLIKWEEELSMPLIIIEEDIIKISYIGAEIPEGDKEKEKP